jgi:hypothetical protein
MAKYLVAGRRQNKGEDDHQGDRYFGSTKEGKFICEHDADKEGDRPTHNGQ